MIKQRDYDSMNFSIKNKIMDLVLDSESLNQNNKCDEQEDTLDDFK